MAKRKQKKVLTAGERKELSLKLRGVSMASRARKIFEYKYGLKDGVFKSNSLVGKEFGITGEAVRQSIAKTEALLKKK